MGNECRFRLYAQMLGEGDLLITPIGLKAHLNSGQCPGCANLFADKISERMVRFAAENRGVKELYSPEDLSWMKPELLGLVGDMRFLHRMILEEDAQRFSCL